MIDSFIHSFVCLFVPSFIYKCNLFTHGALTFIKNSLKRVRAFQIELEFGNRLVFKERRKPKYPEKNLLEQGREPTTNSTHIWRQRRELNTGHIGGRRVLSPLHHPCSLSLIIHSFIHLFGLLYTSYILLSSDWTKNDKTSQNLGVSWCCGNHHWFAFVLWCGYCSVSFQSFVLRHLVITPETDKTCRRHDEHRPLDCVKSSIS